MALLFLDGPADLVTLDQTLGVREGPGLDGDPGLD